MSLTSSTTSLWRQRATSGCCLSAGRDPQPRSREAPDSPSYVCEVGISPYVAGLRDAVGSRLLVLPSVSVLPRDAAGRVLLVRHADSGDWGTIGGFVEPRTLFVKP